MSTTTALGTSTFYGTFPCHRTFRTSKVVQMPFKKFCVKNAATVKHMDTTSPGVVSMNGGDGPYSYAQNSSYQKGIAEAAKEVIRKEVQAKLDLKQLPLSSLNPFRIADFGCSSGPNTILAIQNIIEAVELKYRSEGLAFHTPEFQVFFNDHVTNDFNTLFTFLPREKRYYATAVPGSFYSRLFPKASLHFAYSSCALCWLSKTPEEVMDKTSPAWNKGRIHYTGARKEVADAYSAQYVKDMETFLNIRAQEVVGGGLMGLVIPCVPDAILDNSVTSVGSEIDLLGSCLMDMANMGKISEEKLDSFNLPVYFTYPKELKQVMEQNEYFSIGGMETLKNPDQHVTMHSSESRTLFLRSIFEGMIAKEFGGEIMDELFHRYSKKVSESSFYLNPDNHKITMIFVFLKRNFN